MNNLIFQLKRYGWLVGAQDGKKWGLSWDFEFAIPTHPNWGCSKLLPQLVILSPIGDNNFSKCSPKLSKNNESS